MPRLLSNLLQTTPACFTTTPWPCGCVRGEIGSPDQFLIPLTPFDTENGPPDPSRREKVPRTFSFSAQGPGVSNPTTLLSAVGHGG